MNCTYKMNRYKMSLLIINEQIALHINFYIVFCFMIEKQIFDYCWILQQFRILFFQLKFFDFIVIIIDIKRNLMNVCDTTFEDINHLLCFWYIKKKVLIKCKYQFDDEETWTAFYNEWKTMMYVFTKKKFESFEFRLLINIFHLIQIVWII